MQIIKSICNFLALNGAGVQKEVNRMRNYETVFILNPSLDEETTKSVVEKFTTLISANGEVQKVDEWGKRKLAYEINDFNEGYYVYVEYAAEVDFAKELERNYKIQDAVIRYLIVNKDK
jgi:small subunit ribosomal protein S6